MIDLYALTSPNVQKVFIALEELGLPYKMIPVDVWKGEQYKPEFLKICPNAKIPAIVDHDGPAGKPFTVFEAGPILMFPADKTGKFPPKDVAKRYEVIQWLMIQLTGVGPMFGQLTHFKLFAPPGNDYSLSRYQTEVRRLYDVLEARLAATAYLGGADYTIADMATYPWAANHQRQGVSFEDKPNLKRWHDAVAARSAVQRAARKVEAMPTSRDHAKADDVDRFFGRGR